MIQLFDIGFLPVRIWDILDILIVGFLIYQIYKLLRGSIAFNIFIGVILIYVVSWLVKALQMDLLSLILGQLVSVGVLMLLIVFQPEVRRFLLLLGNSTLRQRSNVFSRLIDKNFNTKQEENQEDVLSIKKALLHMSQSKIGALIVFSNSFDLEMFKNSGVALDAKITSSLIESIFNKESPMHDGAMVISGNKIQRASCVLPLSTNSQVPRSTGLRHRAALGVSETTNVAVFIVSEENGQIAFTHNGILKTKLTESELTELLMTHFR